MPPENPIDLSGGSVGNTSSEKAELRRRRNKESAYRSRERRRQLNNGVAPELDIKQYTPKSSRSTKVNSSKNTPNSVHNPTANIKPSSTIEPLIHSLTTQLEQLQTDEDLHIDWQPNFEDQIQDIIYSPESASPEPQYTEELDNNLTHKSPQQAPPSAISPIISSSHPTTNPGWQDRSEEDRNSIEIEPNNIELEQQAAIQAIIQCLQPQCSCTNAESISTGKSLEEISGLILKTLEKSELLALHHNAPLSLPKPISMYPNSPQWLNWKALLTGYTLDPFAPNVPPTLDFDISQEQHISKIGQNARIESEFDVDSVVFLARSLGVYRHDINWSFRPSFSRAKQRNQRIHFPGIDMTRDKCLPVFSDGHWACHIFFGNLPLSYTNQHGATIRAESQHLDNYTLSIWTDKILVPALKIVSGPGRRHHYPSSFEKIRTDSNIKGEVSVKEDDNKLDTKKLISANLLDSFWSQILRLSKDIPNTAFPPGAFADPKIIISCHNLKLAGFSKGSFSDVRTAFCKYLDQRWNMEYTDREHFWLDLGFERILSSAVGTTILRKHACNKQWAEYLRDPTTKAISSTEVQTFLWAGSLAGSASVNTTGSNTLRRGGLGYSKIYNVIKEQHATQAKDHIAFQDPFLEALSYSKEHLHSWAKKQNQNGRPLRLDRRVLLQHLQKTKERIFAPFRTTENESYGDRQEWRITLDLLYALPDQIEQHYEQSITTSHPYHANYWLLETKHVNDFRMAELNRWLVTLECVADSANSKAGNISAQSLVSQELNSFMVTAMIRIMQLSINCLNPQQFPSIWLGKRWVKSAFSNKFQNQTISSERTLQRRQGLDLGQAVDKYGMMWLPLHLCFWDLPLPLFRVKRYPNLDIGVNKIRATLKISSAALAAATQESLIREFTRLRINEVLKSSQSRKRAFIELCDILAQMCVQAYNLALWDEVISRWMAHTEDKHANVSLFNEKSRRSELSKLGLEVVSFAQLQKYLGRHGVAAVDYFEIAFCKRQTRSTHFPTWSDGTWKGRISPLFRPSSEQPNWARNMPYVQKIEEIILLFQEVSPESSEQYIAIFRKRLETTAARHIQAIFHYDNDKAVSVAKASTHNSQQTQEIRRSESQLKRTKWMFPRFSDEHIKQFAIVNGRSTNTKQIPSKHGKTVADSWVVLTEADKTYQALSLPTAPFGYPPKSMVHKGSYTGGADTLAKLETFIKEAREWASLETDRVISVGHEEDSGEETDWPPRPDGPSNRLPSDPESI